MVFLPRGEEIAAQQIIEDLTHENGLRCPGWRVVPTDASIIGPRALETLPSIRQCFFDRTRGTVDLETSLFRLRKQVEAKAPRGTYFCSLSSRTVVYKGLLTPEQLAAFYRDLKDPEFETSFAIFHRHREPWPPSNSICNSLSITVFISSKTFRLMNRVQNPKPAHHARLALRKSQHKTRNSKLLNPSPALSNSPFPCSTPKSSSSSCNSISRPIRPARPYSKCIFPLRQLNRAPRKADSFSHLRPSPKNSNSR
jgi:hypothetical protein